MLAQRLVTALFLIPLVLAVMLLPPTWLFGTFMAALFLAAQWEWTRLSGLHRILPRVSWLALMLTLMVLMTILHARHTGIWILVMVLGVGGWSLSPLWLARHSFAASPTPDNRRLKLLLGLLAILPSWTALVFLHGQLRGPEWVLLAIILVWASDTGAYVAGRLFGKRKLAPWISPNKTWAGVYGALALGAVASLLGGWLLDIHTAVGMFQIVLLGLATTCASVLGDLIESLLKRQADIKDSGALFPGHGGLLDRMDSIFAALPVFVIGKMLLGL